MTCYSFPKNFGTREIFAQISYCPLLEQVIVETH